MWELHIIKKCIWLLEIPMFFFIKAVVTPIIMD